MFPSSSFLERKEVTRMDEVMSLQGPVLKINGELVLLIPLEAGGSELIDGSRGSSEGEGPHLKVVIPEWIAGMLRIEEGDLVCFTNLDGKFHVQGSAPRPVH
jgi:hypothetical protein